MATYTPGPWTIKKTSDGYGVRAPQWGYVAIHQSSGLKHWEESQAANRLLIAAAPDLLQSLKHMLEIYGVREEHLVGGSFVTRTEVETCDEARAAVFKATGEKQ